jgi:repressor LexA
MLTARQKEVLDFIVERVTVKGYPPTIREIARHFGITSPNGVYCHLNALQKKGRIERDLNVSRGIRVLIAA